MKKILYIIISIVLLLVILFIIFTISYERVNERAYARSLELVTIIEKLHEEYGRSPEDLSTELNAHGFSTKIEYGFMWIEITVKIHEDYFEVYYYEKPLGPFHGYDSQNKEWSYFE